MSQFITAAPRAFTRCCTRPAPTFLLAPRLFSTTSPSAAEASVSSTTSTSSPSSASISPTTPLPYRIGRSNSLNFPVYHRIKSGGTNRTTEVKKVEGDAKALSKRLTDELKLETKVNPRTNHVIIKGFHREKIVQWLTERGL
ncbi:54S ribosomal protein img2, mitochondrial [Sporothrix bragantina]|uniref:Large ribosomal subunit protein mL49 n=1 Tax=Sporothrix bragantina TaxID=671064 RepID=A0ABP0ASH2_9PEZI